MIFKRISIHAAREGGDLVQLDGVIISNAISIHAAREGGDATSAVKNYANYISIHAARYGGDVGVYVFCGFSALFQSTPPVKAATVSVLKVQRQAQFQSTPPVKAAT